MKTKICLSLLGCMLFYSIQSFSQTVDEIVKHYIDAQGGTEKWEKLKTMKMTGNIDIGPNMKAPFTIYLKDKSKFRFEMEIQGMKMIQALDGDSGWSIVPFSGKNDPERMSPEEIQSAKDQADYTGDLYNYKQKGSTVEFLGKEDMEGTETLKLKITKKNNNVTYIYLDAATYLTLKETRKITLKDKEIESASLPSNYQEVSGYKFPFSIEMRGSDEAASGQVMTIESIEVNIAMDDSMFKMPPAASAVEAKPDVIK